MGDENPAPQLSLPSTQNEVKHSLPSLQMPSTTPPARRDFALPTPPLLRSALGSPGPRPITGGPRGAPRLGLAIPPSPRNTPASNPSLPSLPTLTNPSRRPGLPPLQLSTPRSGSYSGPSDPATAANGISATGSSDGSPAIPMYQANGVNGRSSDPQSASSQQSPRSYILGYPTAQQIGRQGTPDPLQTASLSAASDKTPKANGTDYDLPDISQLSLEKGRTADVQDLDDNDWAIASREKRIQQLGGLGEGAGGAVNKCVLTGGKTIFALKVITTDPDPDQKRQIVRELNFNKSCQSAYICKYYGAFVDHTSGTILIAMEYCQGGSLDSVYREVKRLGGRTGENVLGRVAEGVLNGLTYLHSKKIIHRDIKPSNILLCRDGQVKLCDFGVSGEFGTKGDAKTFIGTSAYMAPERIMGQSYTITSDVWSTGVSLLEVAQNRFPFPADSKEDQPKASLIDLITYIVRQDVPTLKDEPGVNPWSGNFKYFIDCCLVKEPNKRASPWKMLEHPWMLEIRSKKVNMEKFLRQVWDWKD